MIIAIDGLAASGNSSTAKKVAEIFKISFHIGAIVITNNIID